MAKPEWGTKRQCQACGAKYYDFGRSPITCPACGVAFDPEAILKARRPRPSAAAKKERVVPVVGEEPEDQTEEDSDVAEKDDDDTADGDGAEGDDAADLDEDLGDDDDDALLEDASELGEDDDDVEDMVEGDEEEER